MINTRALRQNFTVKFLCYIYIEKVCFLLFINCIINCFMLARDVRKNYYIRLITLRMCHEFPLELRLHRFLLIFGYLI